MLTKNEQRLKDIYTQQAKQGIGGWIEMKLRSFFRTAAALGIGGVLLFVLCTEDRDEPKNTNPDKQTPSSETVSEISFIPGYQNPWISKLKPNALQITTDGNGHECIVMPLSAFRALFFSRTFLFHDPQYFDSDWSDRTMANINKLPNGTNITINIDEFYRIKPPENVKNYNAFVIIPKDFLFYFLVYRPNSRSMDIIDSKERQISSEQKALYSRLYFIYNVVSSNLHSTTAPKLAYDLVGVDEDIDISKTTLLNRHLAFDAK